MSRALVVQAVWVWCLAATASSQEKMLTLDELYHPEKKIDFGGGLPEIRWLEDGRRYLEIRTDPRTERSIWLAVDRETGASEPFYDAERLEAAIARTAGVSREEAAALARRSSYQLDPDEDSLLMEIEGDVFLYERVEDRLIPLTRTEEAEELARFAPDGARVSFVRDNDLYVLEIATGAERALTSDGGPKILNGRLDWVYQEEIYGRGNFQGYWWSPEGNYLAFLQLDENPVPEFTLVDHIPIHPEVEIYPYPKAGDPNPEVRLGVAPAAGGPVVWVDLGRYAGTEILIVRVAWTPQEKLVYQVQDRIQTWLDLDLAEPETGASRTLFRETSDAWVNVLGQPHWLRDGSFLWLSERTGWQHLYHYRADGSLIGPVTSGEWELRELHGVDEENGVVYFSGTKRTPLGIDAYRVRLDGSGETRLTEKPGTHQARFNPPLTHFIDTWSAIGAPPEMALFAADGTEIRILEESRVDLEPYRLSTPELLTVPTRDGFSMEAFLLRPVDLEPGRRYPVFVWVYGGPHAPQVRNRWGGTTYMWYQLLAQKGFVVFIVDNRIASGKGVVSTRNVYRNFGEIELRDLEDAMDWLETQPYVDPARIGLGGWSFGGYMTSYAMTRTERFRVGIAGGSVTDWHNYDSIYTERYMSTPQDNPEGYRRSSVLREAGKLSGKILLIHGTLDDNVHLQNTLQLAYELQKAGKPFELMLYPKTQHGVTDPHLVEHLRSLMTRFLLENLKEGSMLDDGGDS